MNHGHCCLGPVEGVNGGHPLDHYVFEFCITYYKQVSPTAVPGPSYGNKRDILINSRDWTCKDEEGLFSNNTTYLLLPDTDNPIPLTITGALPQPCTNQYSLAAQRMHRMVASMKLNDFANQHNLKMYVTQYRVIPCARIPA